MVIDNLQNAEAYYCMSQGIRLALEYLKETDFTDMKTGKYEIKGSEVFALIQEYETKTAEKGAWEAHRRYIDVQYVYQGCELMGYANAAEMQVAREYDETGDYLLLEGEGSFFRLNAGSFAIFAPSDAHMPGLAVNNSPDKVTKVVVKVAVG